jgi:Na+/phosphate symporter
MKTEIPRPPAAAIILYWLAVLSFIAGAFWCIRLEALIAAGSFANGAFCLGFATLIDLLAKLCRKQEE